MNKIKKLIPDKVSILGHQIIMPEKHFKTIVQVINLQTTAINALIDVTDSICKHLDASDVKIQELQKSIQNLAKALQVLITEEK